MLVHRKINDDLTEKQRNALGEETAPYEQPIAELRAGARRLEDFEDIDLLDVREEVFVRDQLVDTAQDEAWKIIGLRESVLAPAGQSRKKVFDTTRIGDIKRASREVTVRPAARISEGISKLPEFEERDGLAKRITERGQAMETSLETLEGVEEGEANLRADLRRLVDAQRVAVVGTYGRLLGLFPKGFVETLFPRERDKHIARSEPEPTPEPTPE